MQNVISATAQIVHRLKEAENLANDAELARLLGVPPKKLAVWKLRNTVPLEELTSFCKQQGYNLEWVLTGEQTQGVAERGEPYVHIDRMSPVEKRKRRLAAKLFRIVEEGNERKLKAVEAQLELLDPGDNNHFLANEADARAGTNRDRE